MMWAKESRLDFWSSVPLNFVSKKDDISQIYWMIEDWGGGHQSIMLWHFLRTAEPIVFKSLAKFTLDYHFLPPGSLTPLLPPAPRWMFGVRGSKELWGCNYICHNISSAGTFQNTTLPYSLTLTSHSASLSSWMSVNRWEIKTLADGTRRGEGIIGASWGFSSALW